ncbi:MAG: carboxypeptidase-like regulatory domain-containing protein [Bacteroidota bacterium]
MKYIILFSLLCLLTSYKLRAQVQKEEPDPDLIQFSGITVTADSLNAVPFTKIEIKNKKKGTTSDLNGYFSLVAHKRDTLLFNGMGFKPASFVIPDSITKSRYSLIQLMTSDTLTLSAAYIFPWPTYEDFKVAFANLRIPDDDLERARKNLDPEKLRMQMENYPMTASMNYNNYIENQTSKLYYFGQQQPFNIFNPFAWAQFIKAWKDGKFKRKKSNNN